MTKKEIEKFNKNCAIFLGAQIFDDDKEAYPNGYWMIQNDKFDLPYNIEDMTFHLDYNLLMFIVERIKYIEDNQSLFLKEYYTIDFKIDLIHGVELRVDKQRIFMQTAFGEGQLKDALINGINEFFKWFKNHKK